jgi:hypothetical protein
MMLVGATLADRHNMVDLKATFLSRFTPGLFARTGPADMTGKSVSLENYSPNFSRYFSGDNGARLKCLKDIFVGLQSVAVIM